MAGQNPMDRFLGSSVDPSGGRGGFTTYDRASGGRFVREADTSKFFTYQHQFNPLALGAIGVIDQFQVDGDADFWINKQAVLAFDAVGTRRGDTVTFQVSPVSEAYNFVETFVSNLGSGRFPNQFPPGSPIILPRNAIFSALASDRNNPNVQTTLLIAHFGGKVYQRAIVPARAYRQRKPYLYVANFSSFGNPTDKTIPAGQVGTISLRTDGDSDFDVRKITVVSDAPITLQIQSDDDNWFQRPIRSELLGGSLIEVPGANGTFSGELPFMLPHPRFITKAGYVNFTVTNLDQVNPNTVQIVLWGTRLYPGGGM
jgi:hypothetical protein